MIIIRRRFKKALVTAALLSIFSMCPTRAQTLYEIAEKISVATVNKFEEEHTRYITASLNIREKPSVDSKIIGQLYFNQKVKIKRYNKKWVRFGNGYISRKYISKNKHKLRKYTIPEYSGYKSFMDYRKITDEGSKQWKLQQGYAYTGDYGIRMIDGRYCVAIGFAFNPKIGRYMDLELENGVVIPCVIADEKDPSDCKGDLIFTAKNGCCTEFVVDTNSLCKDSIISGDISSCNIKWKSPVKYIKIYNKNVGD